MYEKVYAICLEAAMALGDDIKEMSWFGRNHPVTISDDEE